MWNRSALPRPCFMNERIAVGAVKKIVTLWSSMIFQQRTMIPWSHVRVCHQDVSDVVDCPTSVERGSR